MLITCYAKDKLTNRIVQWILRVEMTPYDAGIMAMVQVYSSYPVIFFTAIQPMIHTSVLQFST